MIAYRVAKAKYSAFDGTGAMVWGGRWNSPGRPLIYGSDAFAGGILEIIAHARPRRLPGRHHCTRAYLPDDFDIEILDEATLPGWDTAEPRESRRFGDRWLEDERSAVLSVPSLPARPFGRNLLFNPRHPECPRIRIDPPVIVRWDPRSFGR